MNPPKFRGAHALVQSLGALGVRRVFTLSGNHIMPIFDAALDAGIELIHTRHEAAAVHMADAWARLTGEPGIALVTGGPGHANAVAALYTAAMAESPVVLLSGHAPLAELGTGAFQEMRQAEIAAPLAKASWTNESADTVADDVGRAVDISLAGRPGPVHVSLPTDVLEGESVGHSRAEDLERKAEAGGVAGVPLQLDAESGRRIVQVDVFARQVRVEHPRHLLDWTRNCRNDAVELRRSREQEECDVLEPAPQFREDRRAHRRRRNSHHHGLTELGREFHERLFH